MEQLSERADTGSLFLIGGVVATAVMGVLVILMVPTVVGTAVGVLLMGLGIFPVMALAKERAVRLGLAAMIAGYAAIAVGIALLVR
ncbi:putative membrane protein YccC [Neomicrococcus aestuarii]|uniref:Putative membrane protein YccC n=1 Tax=Neomicrococcus aestuarii TaxID=556325 RepID=A0A7W8X181_9MICC|nr:hypothetical protein [Neomicrococcus aestuarii]MBB5512494.1 putative membrane protein YccC [Neomicrococcus aestuarii]